MWSVWRVVGDGIPDELNDDSTWEGGGNMTAMEHTGRRGWALDFQNDLPGKGSPAELPSGGVPRPSCDKDGNTGALPASACPWHHGYSGERKLPPPMVRLMQHAGPPVGPERQAHGHDTVCQGGEAEEATACKGGDEGEFGAGL